MKVFLLSTTMKNIMCCHMCDVCVWEGGKGVRVKGEGLMILII